MKSKKILSGGKLIKELSLLREKNKRIVFTNGCFDILHLGHVEYLQKAKSLGDILVVGVNSDSSVRKIKGKGRPVNSLKSRMGVLAALESIDFVTHFSSSTPLRLIKKVQPNILVKGGDWRPETIVGYEFVKSCNGRVVSVSFKRGYSTTKLIKTIAGC